MQISVEFQASEISILQNWPVDFLTSYLSKMLSAALVTEMYLFLKKNIFFPPNTV